jgi:hypothetical protein
MAFTPYVKGHGSENFHVKYVSIRMMGYIDPSFPAREE